ncbi:MAG: uroporphyrinogen decarboxylase [Rhodospirillaceae bacterium]|jgi:uroporphyrinogen decarboxylase|nr:uroporphyrinogen decarboxylase [Rhodospirillaceae bacterium]MBT4487469.1 uroporphyrinogen decarboxylase [Rhodospirillaceae bacterium]MBT5193318.1 uroporphyrinogen decarboxylase [Rhodospirillaceae bacterium]MBT5897624.1 uroporphyrinogen decarboxylase [Rhodospirillaceae bacterium]MBT6426658.1 uroporphyrinogen decarboxylase [Rhodospirillaceae bacterium]
MKTDDKLLVRALKGETLDRPPFWFMRQAGRYLPEYRATRQQAGSFLDLCYNPDLATEVTLQPIRRFGMDAAILFADILLIPDGMGQALDYREGEGPILEPVRTVADLSSLSLDGLHERVAPVYETVSRLAAELPNNVTLIGFAGAPWTVATYMVEGRGSRDHGIVKQWAYGDPEGFGQLIDLLVTATVEYLSKQVEAGAEVIQLFDTWAGALSETAFQRWCVEPVQRIVRDLHQKHPGLPIIGFPRGVGAGYGSFAQLAGVNGVSLDWTVPLQWARDEVQSQVTVQGNLDPRLAVVGGKAMEVEAHRILETLGQGPFVFNLGHGFVPETPPEHVGRLAEILRGD